MEILISEVKQRPALWDKRHKLFKNRAHIEKGWEEVAEITGFEKEDAKVKWRSMRDHFLKELKKAPKKSPDGTLQYKGKWKYFVSMSFLLEIYLPHLLEEANVINPSAVDLGSYSLVELISDIEVETTNNAGDQEKCSSNDAQPEQPSVSLTPEQPTKRQRFEEPDLGTIVTKTLELGEVEVNRDSAEEFDKHSVRKIDKISSEEDADLNFFKSLLPFMRKLSDLQKLNVRNQFQTILIRHLSTVVPELDPSEVQ